MDKQVELMGHTFKYYTNFDCSEHSEHVETCFYKETRIEKKRKWLLFGELIETEVPIVLFKIYADANSVFIPKSWWRNEIEKKIQLIKRKEEIENNELI
jgi:hypothetical protein